MAQNADGENLDLLFTFQTAFPDVFPVEVVANLPQALLLSNHPEIVKLTSSQAGNLTEMLIAESDSTKAIQLAFETIFGRSPTESEASKMKAFLESSRSRESSAQQVVWAMLTSPEFRYNH